MGVLDIIGSSGAIQQGTRKHWDFYRGETEERVWRGHYVAVSALYATYKAVAGFMPDLDTLEYDPGRGNATLLARMVGDGETLYELYGNDIYKPVELAKYFAVTATVLTADQVLAVKKALAKGITEAQTGFAGKQLQLWQLMAKGTTQVLESAYVLRETKNVSKRSTVKASYTGDNTVQTPPATATVNTLIGGLPAGEWLKKSPIVRQVGAKRWQIVTEWWWANAWSAVLYGGTASP